MAKLGVFLLVIVVIAASISVTSSQSTATKTKSVASGTSAASLTTTKTASLTSTASRTNTASRTSAASLTTTKTASLTSTVSRTNTASQTTTKTASLTSTASLTASISVTTSISASPVPPRTCDIQFGSYTSTGQWSNEPWLNDAMNATARIDNLINRSSYIVQWYQNWGDGSGDWNNNVLRYLKIALNFTSAGAPNSHMALLTWQPWAPHFDATKNVDYPLTNIANGQYDAYIDTWAKGAALLPYSIYLRPMHEMDGDWYPWGQVNGNTADQYIAAWRHIWSRFNATGATKNVKFVWCPNNSNRPGIDQRIFYPGDQYVDWIGLDAYSWDPKYSFRQTISENAVPQNPYARLTNMTSKPMMIAEFGVNQTGGTPSQVESWFIQLSKDMSLFPNIQALVYFNAGSYNLTYSQGSIDGAKAAFGQYCPSKKVFTDHAHSDSYFDSSSQGGASSTMTSWIRHLLF